MRTAPPSPVAPRARDRRVVAVGLGLLVLGTGHVALRYETRLAGLMLVGAFAGLALYHASFGFTSAFRVLLADGRGAGVRAQMVMLAVACTLFFPLLVWGGPVLGKPLTGSLAPIGWNIPLGAFLFGIGMQLGGGCASGTLFTAGGGNLRMLVTLLFFVVGSVGGLLHAPAWEAWPHAGPWSLVQHLGAPGAWALSLAAFAGIYAATVLVERRRHGDLAAERRGAFSALGGPWPLFAGALALVAVNLLTLLLAGRPWGVTSAFGLWGSKTLAWAGVAVDGWPAWSSPARAASLKASVLADPTSLMDFGIVLGALTASGLAGRFDPRWNVPRRSLLAAVVGGLLLGYGARMAYGCNIGAYFSGIASGSLHGWIWLPAALVGNALGTRLRPTFGLQVERTGLAR